MTDLIKPEAQFERIERFQALQAGHYWRALEDIAAEAIDEGEVLLIESIRWVDNAAHTIVLRAHPSKHGRQVLREVKDDDGDVQRNWVRCGSHRFLLRDFMSRFEFEPNHEAIRTQEVQAIHGQINALQLELVSGQSDPDLVAQITHDGLRAAREKEMRAEGATSEEIEASQDLDPESVSTAMTIVGGTIGDALGTGITESRIKEMRKAIARESQIAQIKADWITSKTTAIAETIGQLTPFYKEQAAAALANTEDVRKQVEQLMLGIESLDLYVGKDVEVEQIKKGASASRDVPLTFVQKKLVVDEELSVWADLDQWFDFSSEKLFLKALVEHEDLVEQIFPTDRCVLVMATTRRYIDYGCPHTNRFKNDRNSMVYLMVRDGENLYRVFSPVESHLHSARLFPSKNEQSGVFAGVDGSQIKFDDVQYTDKLEAHARYALHYKRFLLLACGLDHRLKLFGDFYDGPPTLDFVSMKFQEQNCRFLHDDDGADLLPAESRQSVRAWIADKNRYLRSGSRVLCNWSPLINPSTAPAACREDRVGDGYEQTYRTANDYDIVIAHKSGDSTCVDIEVSGYSWSKNADRKFKCKVNLSNVAGGRYSAGSLPFLCLDAILPEELHWYIHSRDTRRDHLHYIRIFKTALKHITAERNAERATRQQLFKSLVDGQIAKGNEADAIIHQAVIAWRAANRGKPLVEYGAVGSAKPWKALLDQMYVLAGEGQKHVSAVEDYLKGLGLTPLRLIMSGNAKLQVYAAPLQEERDDRVEPHVWVHSIQLATTHDGIEEIGRKWASLVKSAASETTLHEWPDAIEWCDKKAAFSSYEAKQKAFAFVGAGLGKIAGYLATVSEETFKTLFSHWSEVRRDAMASSKFVVNPALTFPVGVFLSWGTLGYVCLSCRQSAALLYRIAPSEESREKLKKEFTGCYEDKDAASSAFEKACKGEVWKLESSALSLATAGEFPYTAEKLGTPTYSIDREERINPSINAWLLDFMKPAGQQRSAVWLSPEILSDSGEPIVDELLGVKIPDNYAPTCIRTISVTYRDGAVDLFYEMYPAGVERGGFPDVGDFMSKSSSTSTYMTVKEAREAVDGKKTAAAGRGRRIISSIETEGELPVGVLDLWREVPISEEEPKP